MHSRTPTSTPLPYTAPFRSEPGSRDPSRRRSGEETSPAAEEIIDDVLEARVFVTRIAVDKNDAETIAFFLHQGEVRLCSTDIARQDHDFPFGIGCDCEAESWPAAASSTRKSRSPSRGLTSCAGKGGSGCSQRTSRRIEAFSAPATRKSARRAASSTGRVRVMRLEPNLGTVGVLTQREVARRSLEPGTGEAADPSCPRPRRIK